MIVLGKSRIPEAVEARVGERVADCNQCGKCTAGCPMAFAMDIQPNQIMRMAQAGAEEKLLRSSAIWMCASCETCATRCPMGVSLAETIDALRQLAHEQGIANMDTRVPQLHQAFLDSVQKHGRVHELGMVGAYKLKTRRLFDDMAMGVRMFAQGKLALMPHRISGRDEVSRILRHKKP